MPDSDRSSRAEFWLKLLLQIIGVGGICALPVLLLPQEAMSQIHTSLGLGIFPREPIMNYLTRSLAMFYAICGLGTFVISLDVNRYRPLIKLWAALAVLKGLIMLGIDLHAEMPWWWTLPEASSSIFVGLIVFALAQRVEEK